MWKDSRTRNQADLASWSLSFLMGKVELIVFALIAFQCC